MFDEPDDPNKPIFMEILKTKASFTDRIERKKCSRILQALSKEEIDQAANTSYAYWYIFKTSKEDITEDIRIEMAMKEVRRHVVGEGGDYDMALEAIREALEFRQEYDVDLFRCCFNESLGRASDEMKREKLRRLVTDDFLKQLMIVRGYDRDYRPIVYKFPRLAPTSESSDEAYIAAQLYIAERSFAASEFINRGNGVDGKVLIIFDFREYASRNAPPRSALRLNIKLLQRMYPERLHTLVFLDPPFWMRALQLLLYPFMAPETRERMKLVSGQENIEELFSSMVDPEGATPTILPDGKLTSPTEMNHFLYHVPFYSLYDGIPEYKSTKEQDNVACSANASEEKEDNASGSQEDNEKEKMHIESDNVQKETSEDNDTNISKDSNVVDETECNDVQASKADSKNSDSQTREESTDSKKTEKGSTTEATREGSTQDNKPETSTHSLLNYLDEKYASPKQTDDKAGVAKDKNESPESNASKEDQDATGSRVSQKAPGKSQNNLTEEVGEVSGSSGSKETAFQRNNTQEVTENPVSSESERVNKMSSTVDSEEEMPEEVHDAPGSNSSIEAEKVPTNDDSQGNDTNEKQDSTTIIPSGEENKAPSDETPLDDDAPSDEEN